jgi:DNA-binding transcriptional LysR family regulator
VTFRRIRRNLDSPAELADGTVDLAVGFMPHLEAGFYQRKLFDQHFVCLVSDTHLLVVRP